MPGGEAVTSAASSGWARSSTVAAPKAMRHRARQRSRPTWRPHVHRGVVGKNVGAMKIRKNAIEMVELDEPPPSTMTSGSTIFKTCARPRATRATRDDERGSARVIARLRPGRDVDAVSASPLS